MKIKNNHKVALMCTTMPFVIACISVFKFHQPKFAAVQMMCFFSVALLSIFMPQFGEFIHKIGERTGHFLGNVLSKIILFLVYIFTVLPTGIIMKIVKRDRLRLKKPDTETYWIDNKEEKTDYEYQF